MGKNMDFLYYIIFLPHCTYSVFVNIETCTHSRQNEEKNIPNKLFVKFRSVLSFFIWWLSLTRTQKNYQKNGRGPWNKKYGKLSSQKGDGVDHTTKDGINVH